ncbi:sensor histidine kinase [Actinomadura macra]|uniref:sensor histidine kinase n=1 Tax=Actinomadura macra TaxID=46164 RepID=UPI000837472A|nr:HAMP domain-containing sensor histidine kinase [Actinomadura macra]
MSVRDASPRVRSSKPRSARARETRVAMGVIGSLLVAAVTVTAVVLRVLVGPGHDLALAGSMAGLCVVALGLFGWGVWSATGRVVRPVARLETEMLEITMSDLARRVEVPSGGDETARLAGRVNAVLARLEGSALQRRAFIADASHELRTPLTGLRTRIELALADPEDGELLDTLRHSLRDVERLHRIVEDLLALARLDSGEEPNREPLDLGSLVDDELARRTPPVPLAAKVEAGIRVEADREQLCSVLLNLLGNAERHAAAMIEVEVRAEGTEAVVEVRDDGRGIPPADRDRVFERFARLDSARDRGAGGSGLGLAIARQVAVTHGGRLYVADGMNGARFVLRLPLLR